MVQVKASRHPGWLTLPWDQRWEPPLPSLLHVDAPRGTGRAPLDPTSSEPLSVSPNPSPLASCSHAVMCAWYQMGEESPDFQLISPPTSDCASKPCSCTDTSLRAVSQCPPSKCHVARHRHQLQLLPFIPSGPPLPLLLPPPTPLLSSAPAAQLLSSPRRDARALRK